MWSAYAATMSVSIHAPVRMRLGTLPDDSDVHVSIHAPVRMRQGFQNAPCPQAGFNSRTREDAELTP